MYCRKCGKKLDKIVTRCPYCGTDVIEVKQKSYAQQYEENKQKEKELAKSTPASYPKEVGFRENNYHPYAVGTALSALILAIFPWPKSWGVGTSLWMRIIVLIVALMAVYNCVKANQICNYNKSQVTKYNRRNPKTQVYYEKPKSLTLANGIAIVVAMLTTFSLFMG